MYKLYTTSRGEKGAIKTNEDASSVSFLFYADNTDYQAFKKDLSEGASLKDAEGNDMTAEQITAFLGELK